MSEICNDYTAHMFKKNMCKNCFQPRDDHYGKKKVNIAKEVDASASVRQKSDFFAQHIKASEQDAKSTSFRITSAKAAPPKPQIRKLDDRVRSVFMEKPEVPPVPAPKKSADTKPAPEPVAEPVEESTKTTSSSTENPRDIVPETTRGVDVKSLMAAHMKFTADSQPTIVSRPTPAKVSIPATEVPAVAAEEEEATPEEEEVSAPTQEEDVTPAEEEVYAPAEPEEEAVSEVTSKRVRAIANYTAAEADELSFNENDEFDFIHETENGWFIGRIGDKKGLCPTNYVKIIGEEQETAFDEPKALEYEATALYDFTAQVDDELSFAANDVLYLISDNGNDWVYARHTATSKEGLVPKNYF